MAIDTQGGSKVMGRGLSFSLEPFNGHNDFTLWQERVKNILTREGFVQALLPKTSKPQNMTEEAWALVRDMASSTIKLYLADNTLREVIGLKDSAEIWEKLESRYKSKSLTSRLYLKKQLYGLKLEEGAQLEVHVDEFNRLLTELSVVDAKIEEEDKALILLASLPASYDHIVTTLLFGKDTLKLDQVISSLLLNESRRKKCNDQVSEESNALAFTGGRGRSAGKQEGSNWQRERSKSRGRKPVLCWHCNKEGHVKRNCPERKESWKKKGNEDTSSSASLVHDDDVMLVTTSELGSSDRILDFGCPFHMCAYREHFTSYQAWEGGIVKTSNGA